MKINLDYNNKIFIFLFKNIKLNYQILENNLQVNLL
jgi:hypothetical protein